MSDFDRVRSSDWSALLRMTADVADLPASALVRRQHLLSSFCQLIGARMASVFDATPEAAGLTCDGVARAGSLTSVHMSAVEHGQLHHYLTTAALAHDEITRALTRSVLARGTVLREQFANDRDWYRSSHYEQVQRPLGMDDQLSCQVILPGGGWAGVALMRERGDRPFDERDRQIMSLFHRHAAHLYAAPKPAAESHLDGLPPRLRPVLQGLLGGDSEKQVATKLGLSPHTVHQYVKQLYRTFDVNSRGELFARLQVA